MESADIGREDQDGPNSPRSAREEDKRPLPPDPADKEVEESGGQEPHAPKPKRELPKRKKKFGRYTRVGGTGRKLLRQDQLPPKKTWTFLARLGLRLADGPSERAKKE